MQGLTKAGESKRARAQANKLRKATGQVFETRILKNFGTKGDARTYETGVIQKVRGLYGADKLPGNKGMR